MWTQLETGSRLTVSGVVVRIDKFGKNFTRAILQIDGLQAFVVSFEDDPFRKVRVGSSVTVSGRVQDFLGRKEVVAFTVQPNSLIVDKRRGEANQRALECLRARYHAVSEMQTSLSARGFLPVQSPTVVSGWVQGDTHPFSMDFYGSTRFLSISNMVYHQMLLADGFNRIYEIGPLHRAETPSNRRKLAEFTILDISMTDTGIGQLMTEFEKVISTVYAALAELRFRFLSLVDLPKFEHIDYQDLLRRSGVEDFSGSQLPSNCRQYLAANFESFVWITGFDVVKRPIYTSHSGGKSDDCQLWYRGDLYLVAGSEIERSVPELKRRIIEKGSSPERYLPYLEKIGYGMPQTSMAGMGVERFLALIIKNSVAADFTHMPRFQSGPIF